MIARIRKSIEEKDKGFTLIELLVVMIIIGILAAIAIPVFLNQRKKAVDTAARSDVSTLGKEIATYYVDAATDTLPTIAGPANGRYTLNSSDVGKVSKGIVFDSLTATSPLPTGETNAMNWCVDVTITGGTLTGVSYSAKNGLQSTSCP